MDEEDLQVKKKKSKQPNITKPNQPGVYRI